ncbi:hypothetical protein ABZ816_33340 [Actinosynnema sp. NPDC047251]|uniref:Uncharacterized protein n=1 Tax=Saccharothrix espanaensis (strain ATCC 51144 / DSM 44229 / JCM 9112 / NBRC 15066 / NRRL 15764) TaxID=1179773 RepID=K0K8N3_SACES|nr:hypothetical protein [Saccharothrix espanaensis]CCH32998.1 hypothetical protein BN6_57400 [Saccharothrix espanaensis DSM 44229]
MTAHTTDDGLEAIAARLWADFAELHAGELTGLEDYPGTPPRRASCPRRGPVAAQA